MSKDPSKITTEIWSYKNLPDGADPSLCVVGVDEAGRGAWAGPVVVACAVWKLDQVLKGLNDSKKMSAPARQKAVETIRSQALAYCVVAVPAVTVDQINVLEATLLGMDTALRQVLGNPAKLILPWSIQIDGNKAPKAWPNAQTVIQGDGSVPAIMAASVLAKTSRDDWMSGFAHTQHPEMHFDRHKGYGVPLHQEALRQHGPTSMHRFSYKPVAALLTKKT